ncbi:hypothetical protein PUR59_01875 [Streptomyces sp. SP18ES09]|uniref:hypothetical protein n=1 Tax=Streptomyces sp. SP18ES09 TaxID=3002532 RepID=UPI002E75A74E|nr:hypothetical protein [Streptomyces sp. SP18ES09]MEE1813786.1 hypothetical protein [Streptomyces sp. SP18ES09]
MTAQSECTGPTAPVPPMRTLAERMPICHARHCTRYLAIRDGNGRCGAARPAADARRESVWHQTMDVRDREPRSGSLLAEGITRLFGEVECSMCGIFFLVDEYAAH